MTPGIPNKRRIEIVNEYRGNAKMNFIRALLYRIKGRYYHYRCEKLKKKIAAIVAERMRCE